MSFGSSGLKVLMFGRDLLLLGCSLLVFSVSFAIPSGWYRAQKPPKAGNTKKQRKNYKLPHPGLGPANTKKFQKKCKNGLKIVLSICKNRLCAVSAKDGRASKTGSRGARQIAMQSSFCTHALEVLSQVGRRTTSSCCRLVDQGCKLHPLTLLLR